MALYPVKYDSETGELVPILEHDSHSCSVCHEVKEQVHPCHKKVTLYYWEIKKILQLFNIDPSCLCDCGPAVPLPDPILSRSVPGYSCYWDYGDLDPIDVTKYEKTYYLLWNPNTNQFSVSNDTDPDIKFYDSDQNEIPRPSTKEGFEAVAFISRDVTCTPGDEIRNDIDFYDCMPSNGELDPNWLSKKVSLSWSYENETVGPAEYSNFAAFDSEGNRLGLISELGYEDFLAIAGIVDESVECQSTEYLTSLVYPDHISTESGDKVEVSYSVPEPEPEEIITGSGDGVEVSYFINLP